LAATAGLLPLITFADAAYQEDFSVQTVIWLETNMLNIGSNWIIKNMVQRKRPYTYNSQVPINVKYQADAQRSFYSLHTAFAFSNSVLFARYLAQKQPANKGLIWIGALLPASGTAYLRYESGQHFFTDIAAGALAGAFWGWLVFELHLNHKEAPSAYPTKAPPIIFSVRF